MVEKEKKIMTSHKIKCNSCNKFKTFPNFAFTGKKMKGKKAKPGTNRKGICLGCDKK